MRGQCLVARLGRSGTCFLDQTGPWRGLDRRLSPAIALLRRSRAGRRGQKSTCTQYLTGPQRSLDLQLSGTISAPNIALWQALTIGVHYTQSILDIGEALVCQWA